MGSEMCIRDREKPRYFVKILVPAIIINIILNYIFIMLFINISAILAITGVAVATVISRYFYMISLIIISKKKLNLGLNISIIAKPIIVAIIMGLAILGILSAIKDMTPLSGMLLTIFGAFIYFIILLLIKGINPTVDVYSTSVSADVERKIKNLKFL